MNSSKRVLVVLFLSFAVSGVLETLAVSAEKDPQSIAFVHTFVIAILVFTWCGIHAKENSLGYPGGYRLLAALIPIIGLPVYFYRFFGFKHGTIKLLKLIAVTALYVAAYLGMSYVAEP